MSSGLLGGPAALLGEGVPEDLAVEGGELSAVVHGPNGTEATTDAHVPCGRGASSRRSPSSPPSSARPRSGAEIAAARLLAPWFGASTIVWANTIATVLVALSDRLLDRRSPGRPRPDVRRAVPPRPRAPRRCWRPCPFVAGPFLRVCVDALDNVEAGAFVGSLLAVLVLIAAPVLLLGRGRALRGPAQRRHASRRPGAVAGRLYAISTLGSLAGVFLSALRADPVRRHAADVPGLRARACAGRGARACAAAARWLAPLALAVADRAARRDRQGRRRRRA